MSKSDELKEYILKAPDSREKIAAWCKVFLGVEIHATVRCTHLHDDAEPHNSQLDYITSAFLNLHRNGVVLAARGAGKSWLASIAIFLDAWFKAGIGIAVCALKREQADYIYEYLTKLLATFGQMVTQLGFKKSWETTKDEIRFSNGSLIRFYSGGSSKGNIKGFHPSVLYVDEGDDWQQARFDGIANAVDGTGKFPVRFDTLSTNYSLSSEGVVLRQIERCKEFNATRPAHMLPHGVFRICLLDILEKCDDRYKCSGCALEPYCKGIAKTGEGGFLTIEHALNLLSSGSKANFESQFLLLRPSSEFTYFHNFDAAKNVSNPEVEWNDAHDSFVIFDFGGSRCPHGSLVMQKDPEGTYYVLDEFLRMGHIEGLISDVKRKYPRITDARCFYDPSGSKSRENVKDNRSYKQALQSGGFFPRARQLKRRQTFELVFNLIEPGSGPAKLKINKRCTNLIRQIQAAECETDKGKPTKEPANITPDDLLDCLRYCVGWTCGTYAKDNGSKRIQFF